MFSANEQQQGTAYRVPAGSGQGEPAAGATGSETVGAVAGEGKGDDRSAKNKLHLAWHLSAMGLVGLLAAALLLGSVCASAAFALLALLPRVRLSPQARPEPGTTGASPFFFGDIAALPGEQFIAGFLNTSTEGAIRQILAQVYRVSQVVARKYYWTRRAASALAVSLLLWAIVLAMRFIA